MVLLTSSTVSMLVTSGVICMTTFLLFLSGYVLQQQSVRSIQEALRRPLEPVPVPTLPPQFRETENDTVGVFLEQLQEAVEAVAGQGGYPMESIQAPVVAPNGRKEPPPQRLAYIFALEEPSHLCSALLFAKQQRSTSRVSKEASIVLLYPSTWESDSSTHFASALGFMRDVQDLYDVVYRPVQIHNAWNTRALLLGELQWGRWDYDQALYLRTPGMALDSRLLDEALSSVDTRQSWAPLSSSSGESPEAMLKTSQGLHTPRGAARKLLLSAPRAAIDGEDEVDHTQAMARDAAFVTFDDPSLGRAGYPSWYADLEREFHAGISTICRDSGLV